MQRTFTNLLALATLSVAVPALAQSQYGAQSTYSGDSGNTGSSYIDSGTQMPAPIERSNNGVLHAAPPPDGYTQKRPMDTTTQPAEGIWLVSAPGTAVQTVSATTGHTELRLEHGRANVEVHHPAGNSEILVDLPGGQVSLVKDGFYTFNADTNTFRVLHGEAEVPVNNAKPIKVKEDHQFTMGQTHEQDATPDQLRADLLQGNYGGEGGYRHGDGYGEGFYGYPYAYGPYGYPGYGFYGPGWGYPGYAFGGPFGWGYPYGYGFGLGFGYYGGFGGFRGGYGGFGGFRGGGGFRR